MRRAAAHVLSFLAAGAIAAIGVASPDVSRETVTAEATGPSWHGGVDPQAHEPLLPPTTEASPATAAPPAPVPAPRRRLAPRSPTPTAPRPATGQSAASQGGSGGRCGGPLPPCGVMQRESGGNTRVYNQQGSGASGKWQMMPGTWNGYGGYANAADAPESVQDERARQIWAGGAGCGHWSAC